MKKIYLVLNSLMVIAFIALTSCSNERLFTEGKYNYLRKVPVNGHEQSTTDAVGHALGNASQPGDTDSVRHALGNARQPDSGNACQQETPRSVQRKLRRINKLTERLNRVLFNSSQTQILSSEKRTATNSETSEKKQTRVGRLISQLRDIHNYPPEKILAMILIALLVILLLIILGPILVTLLLIVLLAVLLLYLLHLYW